MKLLGSTKSKITKDENGKNVPRLEIIEVVWIHWNTVNILYMYTFVPNKSFCQLLDISTKYFVL